MAEASGQLNRLVNTAWSWSTQNQTQYGVMDMEGGGQAHNNYNLMKYLQFGKE